MKINSKMDRNYHSSTKENRSKSINNTKKSKKINYAKILFRSEPNPNNDMLLATKSCKNSPINTLNHSKDKSSEHLKDLFEKINKEKRQIDR